MNTNECANCLVHSWKQPEDETALLQCQNCKLILYCGKECQLEHWIKVHRHHCEYFADPTKNESWEHKEQDCTICLQAAVVGETKLAEVDNPNYECIFKEQFPEFLVHPHPFPVTGQPGDIVEKGIIVLWQLVRKFQLTRPQVALSCHEEFEKVKRTLEGERIAIWRARKIYPQPQAQFYDGSFDGSFQQDLNDIDTKKLLMETPEDPFELWQIIMLIENIVFNVKRINKMNLLKDPLTNLPDDIKNLGSKAMDNTTQFLSIATKILEALTTQVIPFNDVLKIIGGGSLEQECSFCFKEIDIGSVDWFFGWFTPLLLGKYSCGSDDCEDEENAAWDDEVRFLATLDMMWAERKANVCDFCFQRTPVKQKGSDMPDIHRCSNCRTTMYCSQECLYQDDAIHLKVCQKDKEGRKKKPRGSARRKVAREQIEVFELEDKSDIFCEVLDKFKLKNARKEQGN